MKDINTFPVRVYLERFDRGKWNQAFVDRNYPDLCQSFKNPLDPLYTQVWQLGKECPYPAGYVQKFEQGEVIQMPPGFPKSAEGRYRLTAEFTVFDGSEKYEECVQAVADVVDV